MLLGSAISVQTPLHRKMLTIIIPKKILCGGGLGSFLSVNFAHIQRQKSWTECIFALVELKHCAQTNMEKDDCVPHQICSMRLVVNIC